MSGLMQIAGSSSGVVYLTEVNSSGKMSVVDSAVSSAIATGNSSLSSIDSALSGLIPIAININIRVCRFIFIFVILYIFWFL